jgi:hypothetical protein
MYFNYHYWHADTQFISSVILELSPYNYWLYSVHQTSFYISSIFFMLTEESDCGSGNVLMSKVLKYITVKPDFA